MKENDQLREIVRSKYAEIARSRPSGRASACCGSDSACGAEVNMIGDAYAGVEGYVEDADLGLGCGLPVEHAGLAPGHTVLDLGSGAGLDVFVARREVGADGRVIGVDMTPEMVLRARENARRSGFTNVEFRLGEIEHLPVESGTIDVVISNCVLNLVPDKTRAFAEVFRVLKPGGHFCISDVVASRALPEWVKGVAEAYAGCVAGAIPKPEYLAVVREAGFDGITIAAERRIRVPAELLKRHLDEVQRRTAEQEDLHVVSMTLTARKPGQSRPVHGPV